MKVSRTEHEPTDNVLERELPSLLHGCAPAHNRLAFTYKKQLWAITDAHLYWCDTEACTGFKKAVLRPHKFNRTKKCEVLHGTKTVLPNRNGRFLALLSDIGLQVLQLPRKMSSPNGSFLHVLDTTEFREGQRIVHAEWHPGSDRHLCVLTDTDEFRIYYVREGHLSLDSGHSLHHKRAGPVSSFAFAKVQSGWSQFCIYFARDSGELEVMCPVVPKTMVKLRDAIWECGATVDRMGKGKKAANTWLDSAWRQPRPESMSIGYDASQLRDVVTYAGSPLDRSLAIQPLTTQPRRAVPTGREPKCVGIHTVSLASDPASSLQPSLLLKLWSTGHVDIICVLEPCTPCWETGRGVLSGISLHRQALPTLASPRIRAVQVGNSSDIYLISETQVGKMMLPWITQLAKGLSQQPGGMADFMRRVTESTACTEIHRGQHSGYALVRGRARDAFTLVISHASGVDFDRPMVRAILPSSTAFHASEKPDLANSQLKEMFGADFKPFGDQCQKFEDKYNGPFFQRIFGQAIQHCGQPSFDINCPASVQWFFGNVRDKISPLFSDQYELGEEMYNRLKLFDDIMCAQEDMAEQLEDKLKSLETRSGELKTQLQNQLSNQLEIVTYTDDILCEIERGHSALSSAEKQFRQHIRSIRNETERLQRQHHSLPEREKLVTLRETSSRINSQPTNERLVNKLLGPLKDQQKLISGLKSNVLALYESTRAELVQMNESPGGTPPQRN